MASSEAATTKRWKRSASERSSREKLSPMDSTIMPENIETITSTTNSSISVKPDSLASALMPER